MLPKITNFLSLPFTDVDLKVITNMFLNGDFQGKIIVTPNVDHVVRYHKDEVFRDIYSKSDFFFNDSRILRLLSKLWKYHLENVTPGSDLTARLFESGSLNDRNVCILGAEDSDLKILKSKFKKVNFFHYNPPFGFESNEIEVQRCLDYCDAISDAVFFVSVGSPKQEYLAERLKSAGVDGTFFCVGASVLFISGREKRAPLWVQTIGFEWFYRFLNNPKRLFKRYFVDGPYIFLLAIRYRFFGDRK
tara:strand:- start:53 stop:793 length:741 start_codon:yes stop_codon:yes gene_type:complete